MVPQNCSVSHILQNIFLCVQQNKDIHTDLEILEGEIPFWVNYPFNISTPFLKHILLAGDIDFFHRLECFFHLTWLNSEK